MNPSYIIGAIVLAFFLLYIFFFFFLSGKVKTVENKIIQTFLQKVSKIPGLIEVMRPSVADSSAFETLTSLHSNALIHEYKTIYILLEHNARIQREFLFLMKLSMQIPELQKNEQFVYIREFVMLYEKNIKNSFSDHNAISEKWNRFVSIKNATIIGFLLPGKKRELI